MSTTRSRLLPPSSLGGSSRPSTVAAPAPRQAVAQPAVPPIVAFSCSSSRRRPSHGELHGILLQQTAVVAALAVGQTLVILTAGIDLSVGAIMVLSMMVMATLARDDGMPGILALLIGVALATGAGMLNGLLVTRINLPPFIVTLGTLSIFTAIALLYSGGSSIQADRLPDTLNFLGEGFGIGHVRLTWGHRRRDPPTPSRVRPVPDWWGRLRYAVGDDAESAALSVSEMRILPASTPLRDSSMASRPDPHRAGLLRRRRRPPDANLASITARGHRCPSLFGGRGRLVGTLIGALIVQTFAFGLSQMGVDQQWRVLATGVLVIVAVAIDQWIRKVKS